MRINSPCATSFCRDSHSAMEIMFGLDLGISPSNSNLNANILDATLQEGIADISFFLAFSFSGVSNEISAFDDDDDTTSGPEPVSLGSNGGGVVSKFSLLLLLFSLFSLLLLFKLLLVVIILIFSFIIIFSLIFSLLT